MMTDIQNFQLVLAKDGQAITTSVIVAQHFERKHKNVMQSIQNLTSMDTKGRLKFQLTSYIDQRNREKPMYEMDWKSFSILAMGFDGERAFQWKLRFADAFEAMALKLWSESEQQSKPSDIPDYFRKGQTLSRISEDDAALERIFRKRKRLLMEMGFDRSQAIFKAFESIKNSFGIDLSERMGIELPEIYPKKAKHPVKLPEDTEPVNDSRTSETLNEAPKTYRGWNLNTRGKNKKGETIFNLVKKIRGKKRQKYLGVWDQEKADRIIDEMNQKYENGES